MMQKQSNPLIPTNYIQFGKILKEKREGERKLRYLNLLISFTLFEMIHLMIK
jgi:hypothetical protein